MTSNTPIEPQDAAPAHTPAVNAAQVNVTSTGDIQVLVREANGGPEAWFRMFKSDVEGGAWARLLDRHTRLFVVMCCIREIDSGIAYAPLGDYKDEHGNRRPGLLELTGLKRSACYAAVNDFCTDPAAVPLDAPAYLKAAAGLLARRGPDRYAVLPGRIFAGRRSGIAAETTDSPRRGGGKPVQQNLFQSAQTDNRPPGRKIVRPDGQPVRPDGKISAGADKPAAPYMETRARSELRRIENSNSRIEISKTRAEDDGASADREESIRILVNGIKLRSGKEFPGFDPDDARALLARTGRDLKTVQIAVNNAVVTAEDGNLKKFRGYVRTQLERGCEPLERVQKVTDNFRRVADRLSRYANAASEDEVSVVETWIKSGHNGRRLAAFAEDPVWRADDRKFWGAVVSVAIRG